MSMQFWEILPAPKPGMASGAHPFADSFVLMDPGRIVTSPTFGWTWPADAAEVPDWVFANDITLPLSERARAVLDEHLGPRDQIQWIPGPLELPTGETLRLWVPHFPDTPDILDAEHSTIGPSGLPIRWVLSQQKMAGHAVVQPYRGTHYVVVSHVVLDAMRAAGLTGFTAKRARMV